MKGFRQQKQMTKAEKDIVIERNEKALKFQKGYDVIVRKHDIRYGAGLFFDDITKQLTPRVKLIDLNPKSKVKAKKRVKKFQDDYKKFEDQHDLCLVATNFVDDQTNEFRPKIQIQDKVKEN